VALAIPAFAAETLIGPMRLPFASNL